MATTVWTQQPNRVAVVGRLAVAGGPSDPVNEAIRMGLRELGYVKGRDFRLEQRSTKGGWICFPPRRKSWSDSRSM